MDSGHLIFDSSTTQHGQMLLLGGGNPIFRGARSVLGIEEGGRSKRPFFTSPDDLLEEVYYDEQLPEKKRRLTPEQVHMLEVSFEEENKLEPERKSELARKLGLQPRQVAVWFQNRRARWKTKQLERDFDHLKSSYDSLLADHDSLVKDNHHLRAQVISLTDKLQTKEAEAEAAAALGLKPEEKAPGSNLTEQTSPATVAALDAPPKAEDRLSSGTGGSAVVDGEGAHQGLVVDSSGDSYFPEDYPCIGPVDGGVQSEEDDGVSDEGCSYYADTVFPAEHHHDGHQDHNHHHHHQAAEEDEAQLDWWVW